MPIPATGKRSRHRTRRQAISSPSPSHKVEEKKQAGRIKGAPRIIVQAVRNFINSALTRATQRTQRFIRWVRVRLYLDAPWSESMARLRELWTLPA